MSKTISLASAAQSRTFIDTHPDVTPPTSTLYIQRTKELNADNSENHTVTGMHLVFNAGDKNKLYDAFNVDREKARVSAAKPQVVVKSLLIACDVLEIHGELSLPECDVSIYARELIFKNKGAINTSPLPWDAAKAENANLVAKKAGANGAHGRNAGHVKIFVHEVDMPADEAVLRCVSKGGKGQDPGNGANGVAGYTASSFAKDSYVINDSNIKKTHCDVTFKPPAYYIDYQWRWGPSKIGGGKRGTNKPPANGTDALAPGVPGNAGDAGDFITNRSVLSSSVDNSAGRSGDKALSVRGGSAGKPVTSAHYKLTLWHNWFKKKGTVEKQKVKTVTTAKGKDFAAKAAAKLKGVSNKPVILNQVNAWLHPLQLQVVLHFMRDAYLAGERHSLMPLLLAYSCALSGTRPDSEQTGAVFANAGAKWQAAQTEVATLLQRQVAQLDYFGNPAGYMPLLSLQSNMRLYDIETDRALRTLLLAAWVSDASNSAQSASKAFTGAIAGLQDENGTLLAQLREAEDTVSSSGKQLVSLQKRLDTMSQRLSALSNRLYARASSDRYTKAQIKFGIKMAAAICQVIPVGQPALGAVGQLGSIAADIPDTETPDALGKMGDTIAKAKKASDASKAAAAKAKKDGAEQPSKISAAIDGLGPALSLAGEAISALQVPESEIEAELNKLKAASPQWNEMVDDIKELNKDKAKIFNDLIAALQTVGEGYSRLASNADAIVVMRAQNNATLAKLNIDAIQVVADLGQKARISLQKALYLMVKSYETTVLKPIVVNWKLDKVFDGVNTLLQPDSGFDAKTVNAHVKALKPIFQDNLNTVKDKLLDQYGFEKEDAVTLEFGLTEEQTAAQLRSLNDSGSLRLNPVDLGLILPGKQRMTLSGLELSALEFDADGPAPPASGNILVSLRPDADAAMRAGDKLLAVRSNAARPWTWTFHFSSGTTDAAAPSTSSLDLLNSILGSSDDDIKQKLASPPLWSDSDLHISFTPQLPKSKRPRINKLIFKATTSTWAAPTSQRVLDIRCVGAQADIDCSPQDLGERGDGFGNLYRIYATQSAVTLKAPSIVGNRNFSHWTILNNDSVQPHDKQSVSVTLDSHTLAYCHFEAPDEGSVETVFSTLGNAKLAKLAAAEVGANTKLARKINAHLKARPVAKRARAKKKPAKAARVLRAQDSAARSVLIRIAPAARAQVIAAAPEDEITVLAVEGKWQKVQFGSVLGFTKT